MELKFACFKLVYSKMNTYYKWVTQLNTVGNVAIKVYNNNNKTTK